MAKGIEYRIDGGTPVDAGDVLTTPITGLSPSTSYNFEVRKRSDDGSYSAWSSVASGTTASGGLTIGSATANSFADSGSGVQTFSHTHSGNYLLVAVVQGYGDGVRSPVSSVTYDGVGMTQLATLTDPGASRRVYMYGLATSNTGAHNVVVTPPGSGDISYYSTAISASGVTSVRTAVTNSGSDATPTVTATSATGEVVVDAVVVVKAAQDPVLTPGGSQTQLSQGRTGWNNNSLDALGATSWKAGAASTTLSWTIDVGAKNWAVIAVALQP